MYAQVAVSVPQVSGVFDYALPPDLFASLQPGCLVVVPFGKQLVQGIVVSLSQDTQVLETRPIESLLDELPVLTAVQLEAGRWLSDYTLSPLAACLDLMLPPGLSQHADTLYRLNPSPYTEDLKSLSPLQQRLLAVLQERGPLRGRQLEASFSHQNWKAAAQALAARGRLLARPVLPPPNVRPKTVRTVQLACPPEALEDRLETLGRGPAKKRRRDAVEFLMKEAGAVEVTWVYAASGCSLQDLHKLAEDGLVILGETEVWRDPLEDTQPISFPAIERLTAEQEQAWKTVRAALVDAAAGLALTPFILQGVTGSGKTEIYLRAVAETIRLGRQALVLVPEISLTPQTLKRFAARFPGQVGLVHSRLSTGERYDTWRRGRAGLLPVIVGPRSALFTPLPDPGLIVIDECHDDSYCQSDGVPFYNAVRLAEAYAKKASAVLLLGTATPPIDLLHRARQSGWPVLEMHSRVAAHRKTTDPGRILFSAEAEPGTLPLPPVEVVDMRYELKSGNRSIFSRSLQQALGNVLDAGQQAILYLNRRGSATYVFCRDCGESLRCPRCDLPLTYHMVEVEEGFIPGFRDVLVCHTCNYRRKMPSKCPKCGSPNIRHYGAGTEKVETEVQQLFPNARTLRWDAESTRKKGSHEILLSHFVHHHADVLIGTQMLAKGLDLPLVTLVGVVLADVGLNFPDYRASERTFQLLTQVSGRSGRSALGGKVILQTFQPDHPVVISASKHDFEGFYDQEIEQRKRLRYPPFFKLARLEYRDLDLARAEATAINMGSQVLHWIEEGQHAASDIIGPVPCFFSRQNGYYRWQIILRSPDPAAIFRGRDLKDWRLEIDPVSLL